MSGTDGLEILPEWFELENYQAVKNFGAAEWLGALRMRQEILSALSTFEWLKMPLSQVYRGRPAMAEELDAIRMSPTKIVSSNVWGNRTEDATADALMPPVREIIPSEPLWDTRCFELSYAVPEDNKIKLDYCHSKAEIEPVISPEALDAVVELLAPNHPKLQVDLRVTDSILVEAFKIWLKNARAQKRKAVKRGRPSYERWSRYGLLPYLDLLIWSKETGIQISHHLMAEAVDYRKGGDSFRKTVPKLAHCLIQDLGELEALAAIEHVPEIFEP